MEEAPAILGNKTLPLRDHRLYIKVFPPWITIG
jgi:hypothetical protein